MGANAQTVVPTFTAGQVLTAAQLNQSARTGVPVFATTTDRDAAFGGAGEKTLAEGQVCFIEAAPKRLQVYNGTAWIDFDVESTSFTPTWTGYTRGNGTTQASYVRLGKSVTVWITETLGTTSSLGGSLNLTLPITAVNSGRVFGACYFRDAAVNYYGGQMFALSTTSIDLYTSVASGTYLSTANVTSTIPFTWGTNDQIIVFLSFEAA